MTFKYGQEVVLKKDLVYRDSKNSAYNKSNIESLRGRRITFYNSGNYLEADCCVLAEDRVAHYIYSDQIEKHPKYNTKIAEIL